MQHRILPGIMPMALMVALLAACGTDTPTKDSQPSATEAAPADLLQLQPLTEADTLRFVDAFYQRVGGVV